MVGRKKARCRGAGYRSVVLASGMREEKGYGYETECGGVS